MRVVRYSSGARHIGPDLNREHSLKLNPAANRAAWLVQCEIAAKAWIRPIMLTVHTATGGLAQNGDSSRE